MEQIQCLVWVRSLPQGCYELGENPYTVLEER